MSLCHKRIVCLRAVLFAPPHKETEEDLGVGRREVVETIELRYIFVSERP